MRSSWLVLGVLVTMALAGCTANVPNTGTPSIPTQISADQLTPAAGRSMLASAASTMPDKYGMDLTLTSGSAPLLSLHGAFDNASNEAYAEITGDATKIPGASAGSAALAPYLSKGISVYSTKEGSLYSANGTAFVFPPKKAGDAAASSLIPAPADGPLGGLLQPVNGPFKDILAQNDLNITSIRPATLRGQPVIEMQVEGKQKDGTPLVALVDVFPAPPRLAHIESTLPKNAQDPTDPFGGASAVADFYYGGDVKTHASETVKRALGLAYTSDANALQGWKGKATWTFIVSGGVATSGVEVQLKDASQSNAEASMGFTTAPTLWALTLSEATKTVNGTTLAFDDKDHDSKVSAGDTLTITTANDSAEAPIVVLKDLVTGTYVVPGAGPLAALGVLGALAIAARRRT